MTSFESMIWRECQRILENPKMRKKDLAEWSTGELEPRDGEIVIRVDSLGVNAVVSAGLDRRARNEEGPDGI